MVSDVVDVENITKALREGPYGRCVYESDNDVMSHQVGPRLHVCVFQVSKLCWRDICGSKIKTWERFFFVSV